ncbi:MAG: hypothetical protein DRP08_03790 [Candidatus Aenigmatarchaeota archaeon]|nr:MAG: hypothetical protein DRP08_03790 [Candidatus Aenigmarchaeota archaeon]
MFKRELIIIHPNAAYAIILPMVYTNPDKNTINRCTIFLGRKDTAAMFVAKGHGLIDVNIPSQAAEPKAINNSIIEPHS